MLPLRDINPTRRFPILTYALIALNVLVFLWEGSMPDSELQSMFMDLSVVPSQISASPFAFESSLDIVRSMFFHAGWAHLLGNMLYLWLFGDNVEDRLGKLAFLFLYFSSGFTAAYAQVMISPNSTVPLVGASGAIAGVLGSYLVLFPGVRVQGIIPLGLFSRLSEWPAWSVLALWFGLQLFNGLFSIGVDTSAGGGVAFFAHIGGFVLGLVLTLILTVFIRQPPAEERRQALYTRSQKYRF
jgi:membrane associated rhomboid family serine protease